MMGPWRYRPIGANGVIDGYSRFSRADV